MILFPFVRVVVCIALPNLATAKLRSLILILIITGAFQVCSIFLMNKIVCVCFQVPAINLTSNIQMAGRGIECIQRRIHELAEEVKESSDKNLRQMPVENAQEYLKNSMKPFVSMRDTLRKVDESISRFATQFAFVCTNFFVFNFRMLALQRSMIQKIKDVLSECSKHAQAPYHQVTPLF